MWMTWREAMRSALYGPGGFYVRGELPSLHFRTSTHVSPAYAGAMLRLLREADAALGYPARLDLVDVGAGRGELLGQLLELIDEASRPSRDPDMATQPSPDRDEADPAGRDPDEATRAARDPDEATLAARDRRLAARIAARAVEIAPRPAGLDPRIGWQASPPNAITGLVIASEWLDNIPLDVAELTPDGPRLVLVETDSGAERPGPPPRPADLAWSRAWWPLHAPGDRAELGRTRCQAWAGVVRRISRGLAVAADYSHLCAGRPRQGTLTGYRDGRVVRAIPDGSRDITAHVALDACAAAGRAAGATATVLITQRQALRALGVTGRRPPLARAGDDPMGYARALCQASEEAELIDAHGLGAFGWLVQAVDLDLPASLTDLGGPPA
jgi:SAM-dependent MidA family methyltransferase